MRRIWKGLAMLAPLALVGGLVIALPVQATHDEGHDIESGDHVANCELEGFAELKDGEDPAAIPFLPQPPDEPTEGDFEFEELVFTCAVTTVGEDGEPGKPAGTALLEVSASGTFSNTGACGVGTAEGSGTGDFIEGVVLPPGAEEDEFPVHADFHIEFGGEDGLTPGVGVITLGEHTPDSGDASHGGDPPDSPTWDGGWGDGTIVITPTGSSPEPNPDTGGTCATGFVVTGAFELVLKHDD